MLHLKPRVHLHEVELLRLAVVQELDRACVHVPDRARSLAGSPAHLFALFLAEARRRLLDDFLVPALDGAVALEEVHVVAVDVSEDLDLVVARPLHKLFEQHAVVTERVERLALGAFQVLEELLVVPGHLHAFAASAHHGFDHHRVLDLARLFQQELRVLVRPVVPGRHRHARLDHDVLRLALRTHLVHRVARRTDELYPARLAQVCEPAVLREEAVARVDALRTTLQRSLDNPVHPQVAVGRGRAADVQRLVAHGHVSRVLVCVRVDRDSLHAELSRRVDDPACDLSSVGDQYPLEHRI